MASSVGHVNKFWGRDRGGIEAVLAAEAGELARRGWGVKVLACRARDAPAHPFPAGVNGVELPARTVAGMPLRWGFRGPLRDFARECDLLHFHLPFPLAESAALRIPKTVPWVASVHAEVLDRPQWQLRWQRRVTQRFLARVDRILVSAPTGVRWASLSPHRERVRVLPFGFDLNAHAAERPRTEARREPAVIFLGRLVWYKGLDVLLQAAVNLPARIEIVGEGRERQRLERLARQLGVEARVVFRGHVPDAEVPSRLAAADVFVLPSRTRAEAFGVAQVEAMAAGLPVVNTALGTGTDWVSLHGVTGLTVPPGDPQALHGALRQLLADSDLRALYGRRARQRARKLFDLERHGNELTALYRELGCNAGAQRQAAS